MKRYRYILLIAVVLLVSQGCVRKIRMESPDGKIRVAVKPGPSGEDTSLFSFSLAGGGETILEPSSLYLNIEGKSGREKVNLINMEVSNVRNNWTNSFGERKEIPDNYNQLKLFLMRDSLMINVILRVYDEGVALAYEFPSINDSVTLNDENIIFRFTGDHLSWSAPRAQALYRHVPLSKIDRGCERPLVVEPDSSITIALGEAALVDFARMKFDPDSSGGHSVKSRLDGKATMTLPFRSPWRYVLVGKSPGDLIEKNYMILNLNEPSAITDQSWIKPGKALREVTLTTEGGKAAVDFTSSHGMQYVEFDAGWYGPENDESSDARAVNLDPKRSKGPLDLRNVIDYASSKNIGVLLYVNRRALERQLDSLLPIYKEWGVKGIKFGFVQVGSQEVTSWLHEAVRKCASYNMVVDIHDEYRPTGFSRTYPNLLTQEGIRGDEESPANSHTLITMFTRMIAGAGDNTICYYNERVRNKMGSHASQLAKAVCIFSPLQFHYWYDRAVNIGDEPELEFFSNVPTVWDETRVLHGRIGEYGVIARRSGNEWFIGGINGAAARELDIDFNFLEPGSKYSVRIYSDDPSVRTLTQVRIDSLQAEKTSSYRAIMGANRGLAMHLRPL